MMRDYAVYHKGVLIGVFRDFNEAGALSQAYQKAGGASKFSGASSKDFVVMKLGIL